MPMVSKINMSVHIDDKPFTNSLVATSGTNFSLQLPVL